MSRRIPDADAGGGRDGRTIIAGYPWFNDWGRDSMINRFERPYPDDSGHVRDLEAAGAPVIEQSGVAATDADPPARPLPSFEAAPWPRHERAIELSVD